MVDGVAFDRAAFSASASLAYIKSEQFPFIRLSVQSTRSIESSREFAARISSIQFSFSAIFSASALVVNFSAPAVDTSKRIRHRIDIVSFFMDSASFAIYGIKTDVSVFKINRNV